MANNRRNTQSSLQKFTANKTSGQLVSDLVGFSRELIVQGAIIASIFVLMGIDMILGGVSMYFMFKDVPFIPPALLAGLFTVGLSALTFILWANEAGEASPMQRILLICILLLVPLDLWIDLSFMEIVYGTGNVWRYLEPAALAEVHRPPLWWGFSALVAIVTLINEPLSAMLVYVLKNNADMQRFKHPVRSNNQSKSTGSRKTSNRQQPRPMNRPTAPSVPVTYYNSHMPQNAPKPSPSPTADDIRKAFG